MEKIDLEFSLCVRMHKKCSCFNSQQRVTGACLEATFHPLSPHPTWNSFKKGSLPRLQAEGGNGHKFRSPRLQTRLRTDLGIDWGKDSGELSLFPSRPSRWIKEFCSGFSITLDVERHWTNFNFNFKSRIKEARWK